MKTCIKCGTTYENPVEHFSPKATARDGFHPYCHTCKAAAQRMSRLLHPDCDREYYRKNAEKKIAQVRVRRAVKQGRIKPAKELSCSMAGCKRTAAHYHHLSYDLRAEIAPVCQSCHAQLHSGDASERDLTKTHILNATDRWSSWFGECEN